MNADFPTSQQEYDLWLEHEEARLNHQHNVIKTSEELEGWTIIALERWKPDVVRFHAKKRGLRGQWHFQMGFGNDCLFYNMQLPPTLAETPQEDRPETLAHANSASPTSATPST